MVDFGMINICLEVSMMLSHLALHQGGHMVQMYHIFAYLKNYHNSEFVLDPSDQFIDQSGLERQYCTSSKFFHVFGK